MSDTLKLPYYTMQATNLADWLDRQPELWWIVDGDPLLTSYVDFPCPSEELSAELRRINAPLRIYDPRPDSMAQGESIDFEHLTKMANTDNNSRARTYLLCWEKNDDLQWLLAEYRDAASESA